ncbi:MAG: double zinc ribbon domain-containing protein [Planctomycetota bacterium]
MAQSPGHEPSAAGERVRFCLGCGDVLPFELRHCPACGRDEPLDPGAPCPSCSTAIPAGRLFCPGCGHEASPPALNLAKSGAEVALGSASWREVLLCALAVLAPLLTLLALWQRLAKGWLG